MLHNRLDKASLADALEQSTDCVKILSEDGRLEWMNPNGMCAMEIADFTAMQGREWRSFWPEDAQDLVERACAQARDGSTARFTAACPTALGTPRYWDVSVQAVRNTEGENAGFLSISRDITEAEQDRRALQATIDEMRHRLKNSYALFSSLAAGIARNPSWSSSRGN